MQKDDTKKTASAPKRWLWVGLTIVVLILLVASLKLSTGTEFGSRRIKLEKATTEQQRIQGLSGREKLADNAGLLFIFDAPGRHCIWMKDMKFAIDIVWLDESGKVISIEERVSPSTYPDSYCPDKPATYVIEVNEGVAGQAGVRVGQTIDL